MAVQFITIFINETQVFPSIFGPVTVAQICSVHYDKRFRKYITREYVSPASHNKALRDHEIVIIINGDGDDDGGGDKTSKSNTRTLLL